MDFATIVMGAADIILIFINIHLWKSARKNAKIDISELKLFTREHRKRAGDSDRADNLGKADNIKPFGNSLLDESIFERLKKPQQPDKSFSAKAAGDTMYFYNNKTKVFPDETATEKNFFSDTQADETTAVEKYDVMEELIKQVKNKQPPELPADEKTEKTFPIAGEGPAHPENNNSSKKQEKRFSEEFL